MESVSVFHAAVSKGTAKSKRRWDRSRNPRHPGPCKHTHHQFRRRRRAIRRQPLLLLRVHRYLDPFAESRRRSSQELGPQHRQRLVLSRSLIAFRPIQRPLSSPSLQRSFPTQRREAWCRLSAFELNKMDSSFSSSVATSTTSHVRKLVF